MLQVIDCIPKLNILKKEYIKERADLEISKPALISILKECQLPIGDSFIRELVSIGVLTRQSKKLSWTSEAPIHYKRVENAYKAYQTRRNNYMREYMRTYNSQKREIADAISLLKEQGYIVLQHKDGVYIPQ